MATPAIIFGPEDVDYALSQLGLDRDGLAECAKIADSQRALCTSNDVKGFDLILMNDKIGRALREQFVGKEWEKDEFENQPGIKNPKLRIRVIPCNFDDGAGRVDMNPSNLCTKGAASRSKTRCNKTPWLRGLEAPEEIPTESYTTYVFGTYFEKDCILRAELSLPLDFKSGKYLLFKPRIIILSGDDENGRATRRQDREGPTEIVDIPVARR